MKKKKKESSTDIHQMNKSALRNLKKDRNRIKQSQIQ